MDELPEEGFTTRLNDMYWTKGGAIVICPDEGTRDWLASKVPTLKAWEASRLKMVGLDALPTHKKSGCLVPGPCGGHEVVSTMAPQVEPGFGHLPLEGLQHREGPNGVCLVHSIDSTSFTALERLGWRPFSGMGQAIFSLLGVKTKWKK